MIEVNIIKAYARQVCSICICVKQLQERQAVIFIFIRIGLSHGESMKLLY